MMLDRREMRAQIQKELLEKHKVPLVSFSMNIAGPVKSSDIIITAFFCGLRQIKGAFKMKGILAREEIVQLLPTGPEAFFSVDYPAYEIKELAVDIEENSTGGRLFDIDVIGVDGLKVERCSIGFEERKCLICDNEVKVCSSRRLHSLSQLKSATDCLLDLCFRKHCDYVASLAVKALLYEVCATPKPGLVDRNNSGSHIDMDFYSFLDGSGCLFSYFSKACSIGFSCKNPYECFALLKKAGKEAEKDMFFSTCGVNTHKGAVYTMGILVCAAAIAGIEERKNTDLILDICRKMTKGTCEKELENALLSGNCTTGGEKAFSLYKVTGIRGEVENGLPSVKTGLEILEKELSDGKSNDDASASALLTVMTVLRDTCLISRGGPDAEEFARKKALDILAIEGEKSNYIKQMDEEFISRNLSPGGCADMLAACWFLHFLKEAL